VRTRAIATVAAVLSWVLPSVALAECGLIAVRQLVAADLLLATNDVVGNYLQTLGSIYAVLLAFVVFVVWTQFNDAKSRVEVEANELVDLYRTAKGLPEPTRGKLQQIIRAYVDLVAGREWDAMACGEHHSFDEGDRLLDSMWDALNSCNVENSCHSALFSEALARFNGVSDARTNRLASSQLKIPLALHILLYMGAVVTVGSMYLFAVDRLSIHLLLTGAMAGALSHILYVVHDLDDCFGGAFQVPRSSFERVRRHLAAAA
jgi:uncharacterized protein DUF4239